MGCCMYNLENNIPAEIRGCTAFAYFKDKSEIYSPSNGNRFNITTSSFINGEEVQAGFNSCFIVRYLLEKANNTKNSLSLLMKLPIASNCSILIADKNGEMIAARRS